MRDVVKNTPWIYGFMNKFPNALWAILLSVPTTFFTMMISLMALSDNFFQGDSSKVYFGFFLFVIFAFIWEVALNILGFKDDMRIADKTLQTKYKSARKTYKRYCKLSLIVRSIFFLLWAGTTIWFNLWNAHENVLPLFFIVSLFFCGIVIVFIQSSFFYGFSSETHSAAFSASETQTTSSLDMWDKSAAHTEPSGAWVPLRAGAPVDISDAAYFGRLGKD